MMAASVAGSSLGLAAVSATPSLAKAETGYVLPSPVGVLKVILKATGVQLLMRWA
jgi:hypothetical protein